jgi:tetratricopeptide (TPR) repeat protein
MLGAVGWVRGDLVRGEEWVRHGLKIATRLGDQAALTLTAAVLGDLAAERGDLVRAEEWARCALSLAEPAGDPSATREAWNMLAWVACARGDLAWAEEQYRRSADVFARVGDLLGGALSWAGLGEVACARGALSAAAANYRHARRLAQGVNAPLQALVTVGEARARLRAGRLRQAAALLAHTRSLAGADLFLRYVLERALVTAELHLSRGETGAADAAAQEALRMAVDGGRCRDEARARTLLGHCALARGRYGAATSHLRAALAPQVTMGTTLEAARTRLALAEALAGHADAGPRPDEAVLLLAEAAAQFARSGAALDLTQADRLARAWGTTPSWSLA